MSTSTSPARGSDLESSPVASMPNLLAAQIRDLYFAENALVSALEEMKQAASCKELKEALGHHRTETQDHVKRLEQVARELGISPEGETCEAMEGLLAEGQEILDAEGDPDVKDSALIASAQRVEHYEMAGYGSARAFANQLGLDKVAALLQETLDQEGAANKKLMAIAEGGLFKSGVNAKATGC